MNACELFYLPRSASPVKRVAVNGVIGSSVYRSYAKCSTPQQCLQFHLAESHVLRVDQSKDASRVSAVKARRRNHDVPTIGEQYQIWVVIRL